jgi:hypothetical protein
MACVLNRLPLLFALLVLTSLSTGCLKPPPAAPQSVGRTSSPLFRAVGNNREIMLSMTIPFSDVVFNAAADPPTTGEQWIAIERASLALAESGNLLLIPGRAVDDGDWARYSDLLISRAALAYVAAQSKDVEGISDAGNLIYEACEGCHKQYVSRPPLGEI